MKTWQISVKLNNVRKTFGTKTALDISSCEIHPGEIIGLVGNNGAGKTTLFRIILDLLKVDKNGSVFINDFNTDKCEDWKDITGAYIDNGFLIDYLTPDEFFSFVGKINDIDNEEINKQLKILENFLGDEILGQNKLLRNLSAGNQQKVGIAAAMLHTPGLLILDEPFNFLDPSSQLTMKRLLADYNKQTGATVLFSSHNILHTLDICNRVILLEQGKIIKDISCTSENSKQVMDEIEKYFEHHS